MFRFAIISISMLGMLLGCRYSEPTSPDTTATLNDLLGQAVAGQRIPGLAAAVISSSSVRTGVAGIRKSGDSTPVIAADQFHLGSNIKALTAQVSAALVERGIIQWSTTVTQVFPELQADMRPEFGAVTLAQLLTHRGGIRPLTDPVELSLLPTLPDAPRAARYALSLWLLKQAPVAVPGGEAVYSNAGYTLAAAMLERQAGRDFESMFEEYVLRPVNASPRFDWPAAQGTPGPWGHEYVNATWLANDPNAVANRFPPALTPAGNLSLNISEYAQIIQLQLRGLRGQAGNLSASTYSYLHTPQGKFALGWLVSDLAGVRTSAHDGSAGTFYAVAAIQPGRDRAVVLLANGYSEALANAVNALALRLLELTP